MRLHAVLVLSVAACTPCAPPAERVGATPAPEPIAAAPSRSGECTLGKALDAYLSGQDVTNCGELPSRPADEAYERARACVMAAQRARKAFKIVWGGQGIDSITYNAVAGRAAGGGYEVRWFSYDSCPSGCGTGNPTWNSVRCEPLVDLRAACQAPAGEARSRLCDPDDRPKARSLLELRCDRRTDPEGCGPSR